LLKAGTVYLDVLPDLSQFGPAAQAQIRAQMGAMGKTASGSFSSSFATGATGALSSAGRASATSFGAAFSSQLRTSLSRAAIGSQFASLLTGPLGIAAVAGGIVLGVGKIISAASDLGEQMNRTKVTFEGSSEAVIGFANNASKIGLAKTEALEAASGFGTMFQTAGLAEQASAAMSVQMVELAADMASFNNQDPSEMLDRLRSGLAGEAEPLRQFGVFISEAAIKTEAYTSGIAAAGSELTDAQKIQARYNVILAQTAKQQGDFARTSESLPNQMRILGAEFTNIAADIGQVLIPVALVLVKTVRVIIDVVGVAADVVGTLAGGIIDIAGDIASVFNPNAQAAADAIEGMVQAVESGQTSFEELRKRLEAIPEVVRGEFARRITEAQLQVDNLGGAFGDAGTGLAEFAEGFGPAEEAARLATKTFDRFALDLGQHDDLFRDFVSATGQSWDEWVAKAEEAAISGDTAIKEEFLASTMAALAEWRRGVAEQFNFVKQSMGDLAASMQSGGEVIAEAISGADLGKNAKLDVSEINKSLRQVTEAALAYDRNWAEVMARAGGNAALVRDAILNMGAEGGPALSALAGASETQFGRFIDAARSAATNAQGSADDIIRTFQSQLDKMVQWGEDWEIISRRAGGDADSLKFHIASMGEDGIGVAHALATANDKEFGLIMGKWNRAEDASKDLATQIQVQLIGMIGELINKFNDLLDLPHKNFKFTADTNPAEGTIAAFMNTLPEGVIVDVGIAKSKHKGGLVEGPGGGKGLKSDEQLNVLKLGEWVVDDQTTARHRELLEELPRMHLGGLVGGPTFTALPRLGDQTIDMDELLGTYQGTVPIDFAEGALSFDWSNFVGAASGGYVPGGWGPAGSPAINAFRSIIFDMFPALMDWGMYNRRYIAGTTTWSQHAYGNAQDLGTPSTAYGNTAASWIASTFANTAHLLWQVANHFDHIHWDPWPQGSGTPLDQGGYSPGPWVGWGNVPEWHVPDTPKGLMSLAEQMELAAARRGADHGHDLYIKEVLVGEAVAPTVSRTIADRSSRINR
jgi:hypothetical protein